MQYLVIQYADMWDIMGPLWALVAYDGSTYTVLADYDHLQAAYDRRTYLESMQ